MSVFAPELFELVKILRVLIKRVISIVEVVIEFS